MKLTLIRGLPGSGKSTLAKDIVDAGKAYKHLEADQWLGRHYDEDEGKWMRKPMPYFWSPERAKNAHKACQEETEFWLQCGESVVVSNTFTQVWEIEPYLKIAARQGAEVEVIEATGNYGSIHDVPAEVIEDMRNRWEAL